MLLILLCGSTISTAKTSQIDLLHSSLGNTPVVMGDLILTEVLQGFQDAKQFKIAKGLLTDLPFMPMVGRVIALQSAENYRSLRRRGVTVRRTIDVLIGTFCIYNQLSLLHDDRDFDPIVKFLGLKTVST